MKSLAIVLRIALITAILLFIANIGGITLLSDSGGHGRWSPFVLLGAGVHLGVLALLGWGTVRIRSSYPAGLLWAVLPWVLGLAIIGLIYVSVWRMQ